MSPFWSAPSSWLDMYTLQIISFYVDLNVFASALYSNRMSVFMYAVGNMAEDQYYLY